MASLSDPPCLIEQELYVENADWILHTLSTRKCSSNDRLRPRGGGVLSYFHTYVDLGHVGGGGLKLEFRCCFFGSQKNEYFLGGMKNIFLGCLKLLIFFGER